MKATAEKIEKNTVVLDVEVEAAKLEQALDSAYRKLVKKSNIPGFRKGKAPRAIMERHYGKEYILNEALDIILPDAYVEAVDQTEIEPIDRPQIELVQAEEGKDLIFKAKVEVKPEVTLGDYKGLEVNKPSVEVSDEDVDAEITKLQQRHAQVSTLDEGTVEQGDIAVIDFEGFKDGVAFPGGKGDDYPLEIGSGSFIPGFEEQLIGVKTGESKDVEVTFPENYQAEDLAGQPAVFKVTVKSIRRKEMLPLDDEFAKDVSDFDTLEELKADTKNKLKEAAENRAEFALKDQLIAKAVENASIEVPQVMVDARIRTMLEDMSYRLQRQGISLEDYFKFTGSNINAMMETMKPEAEKGVTTDLVLETIARTENIDATDEEVDAELAKMAEEYKQDVSVIKATMESQGQLDNLKNSIAFKKTVDFLVDNAKLV
ncbi:MAG TPA: trigger factor [Bacillota bacterium]|nr:trigger factor [Bacillota bacterium]